MKRFAYLVIASSLTLLGLAGTLSSGAGAANAKDTPCGAALSMSVGRPDRATGVTYYPIVFTNSGKAACSISGTPEVETSTSPGAHKPVMVGFKAKTADPTAHYGKLVVLPPKSKASADYGVRAATSWSNLTCAPVKTESIKVSLAHHVWWGHVLSTVCTHVASTTITGVVPGSSGVER
jgi:hypothetical protein